MKIFKGDIVNGIKKNNTSHSSKQIENFDENTVMMDDLTNEIKLKHEGNSKLTELISDIKESHINNFLDYFELANGVADEEILNDKDLARKIYLEAEKVAEEFDEYKDLATSISDTTGLNDKVWAKVLFIKAIKEEKKINNVYLFPLIGLTKFIVNRNFLDDKEFAIEIYKDIEKRLRFKEECILLAYEIFIKIKNKEWAKELFSKRSNLPEVGSKWTKKILNLEKRLEKL